MIYVKKYYKLTDILRFAMSQLVLQLYVQKKEVEKYKIWYNHVTSFRQWLIKKKKCERSTLYININL